MAATYRIYVPTHESPLRIGIKPGSALVGGWQEQADGSEVFQLDFEGNVYGAEGLDRYGQRCMHAAGRLAQNYPTTARRFLPREQVAEQLVEIGVCDEGERLVGLIEPAIGERTAMQALDNHRVHPIDLRSSGNKRSGGA